MLLDKAARKRLATSGELMEARQAAVQRQTQTRMSYSPSSVAEKSDEQEEDFPLFFDVHKGDSGQRTPLASLEVKQKLPGTVIGTSLHDGLRIDIGAEVDALVPMNIAMGGHAVPELGTQVSVSVEEIHLGSKQAEGASRRFPLIVGLVGESELHGTSGGSSSSRGSLRIQRGVDPQSVHAARGYDTLSPGVRAAWAIQEESDAAQSDDIERGDADAHRRFAEASAIPRRPPPEVVLSLNASGDVSEVEVPREARSPVNADDATLAAWRAFASEELSMVALEQRCRDQLAKDLNAVEIDLYKGRAPTVPAALLGLITIEDGRRGLLPIPNGDHLQFKIIEPDHPNGVEAWVKEQRKAESDKQQETDLYTRMFACADARHARALQATMNEELSHVGLSSLDEMIDGDLMSLSTELEQVIASSPEIRWG